MKARLSLTALVFALALSTQAAAESKPAAAAAPKSKTMTAAATTTTKSSADVLKSFFEAFGKGDADGVVNTFHQDAAITAVRKASDRKGEQLHGTYTGKAGAKEFVANMGKAFDTKAFSVEHLIGEGDVAYASGSFVHNIRSTGKPYASDWALKIIVKEGKILEYHFYEDSAGFIEASKK
ncbi:nuclear transport factor 2 family protein [Corallococcus sp. CA053C]|uniref:nuclear transport factor 2 family protein n=1 Tax=Corallococcus sp. CA053C TaxID=2316732 RepID=UPI0018F3404E|nr:nuclear transport factor 2 family protein [Corallococcus sp. CA053C]